jgi:hypothetical protein
VRRRNRDERGRAIAFDETGQAGKQRSSSAHPHDKAGGHTTSVDLSGNPRTEKVELPTLEANEKVFKMVRRIVHRHHGGRKSKIL